MLTGCESWTPVSDLPLVEDALEGRHGVGEAFRAGEAVRQASAMTRCGSRTQEALVTAVQQPSWIRRGIMPSPAPAGTLRSVFAS